MMMMGETGNDSEDYLLNDLSLGGAGDDSAFAEDDDDDDDGPSRRNNGRGVGGGSGSGSGSKVAAGVSLAEGTTASRSDGPKVEEPRRRKGGRVSLFPTNRSRESDQDDDDHDRAPTHPDHQRGNDDDDDDEDQDRTPQQPDENLDPEDTSTRMNKDQKLKESLWELKKMVGVFKGFEDSLRCGMEGNEVGGRRRLSKSVALAHGEGS